MPSMARTSTPSTSTNGACRLTRIVTCGIFNDKFTTYYTVDWRILQRSFQEATSTKSGLQFTTTEDTADRALISKCNLTIHLCGRDMETSVVVCDQPHNLGCQQTKVCIGRLGLARQHILYQVPAQRLRPHDWCCSPYEWKTQHHQQRST